MRLILQLFSKRGSGDISSNSKTFNLRVKGSKQENAKPANTSFKVNQKTFKVKDGVVEVSMFDRQNRINAVRKKAEQNGWVVKYVK